MTTSLSSLLDCVGLNIFNSKYLVADSRTATDEDYMNVERVIAHEVCARHDSVAITCLLIDVIQYFHNYTGNRVTLRDWFQLSLKEGLTVFREDQFMADHHSPAVQRINKVNLLRNSQFKEVRLRTAQVLYIAIDESSPNVGLWPHGALGEASIVH